MFLRFSSSETDTCFGILPIFICLFKFSPFKLYLFNSYHVITLLLPLLLTCPFLSVAQEPNSGVDNLVIEVSRLHTIRHTHTHTHTHIYTAGKTRLEKMVSTSHRPLPTQHTEQHRQETNIPTMEQPQTYPLDLITI